MVGDHRRHRQIRHAQTERSEHRFHALGGLRAIPTAGGRLIHGHTWLDLKVDPALTTMANPYDYFARRSIAADGTHTFYWDHAYYNGHYYCYFGVVPALLTFVPFQLVTGHWMPTWAAMGVFTTLAVVFGTLLVRRLAQRLLPEGLTRRRVARHHRVQRRHQSVRLRLQSEFLWNADQLFDCRDARGPMVLAGVETPTAPSILGSSPPARCAWR